MLKLEEPSLFVIVDQILMDPVEINFCAIRIYPWVDFTAPKLHSMNMFSISFNF